jgi:hypothetical protein
MSSTSESKIRSEPGGFREGDAQVRSLILGQRTG